ncbi:hypothetical protein BP6252_02981 [Coleophoma cylindrospora]|uniref:non-reducing end alpha-L-arabinofuranosidase n=1 Tax=Coleophoma cylindrospora TaxID=1849047 RepID=A0A3D8S6E1_9HELO|nr:hypothetical protein BP6252_02981 [Coleophoma cylindrospora]
MWSTCFVGVFLICLVNWTNAISLSVSPTGGNASSPYQYGIMFEDINHSGDGGVYAELIQNRAFQGSTLIPSTLSPWVGIGNASLALQNTSIPLSSSLPTSVNVAAGTGVVGIRNPGFWGIDVKVQTYQGSFWVMGSYNGTITASLESTSSGEVLASTTIKAHSKTGTWSEYHFSLVPTKDAPDSSNTFSLAVDGKGIGSAGLNFNLISLFPPTYKNRPNGMRPDLMEVLKGLNPSFLRMPGGNNLEGRYPPYHWFWNLTIGPLKDRPGRPGPWGYANTDGLGLVEYFQWCDDLEMEPILAVFDGLYLNRTIIPEADLAPYVQDTMNELEFIMGSTDTVYGALRASVGYPKPWNLKYIGNEDNLENGLSSYNSYRFAMYYDAITAKYPDMNIISSTDVLSTPLGNTTEDYHIYTNPPALVQEFNYFDQRTAAHKTLVGEYAITTAANSTARLKYPTWIGSVAEAVFLIGIERNSEHMFGASYAPLLENLNSVQWSPDMISFVADPAKTVLSTSYHLTSLFSKTRFTTVLPVNSTAGFGPCYWVAGLNSDSGEYILKAANYASNSSVPFTVNFGAGSDSTATLTLLTATDINAQNVLGGTNQVITNVTTLVKTSGAFSFDMPSYSALVLTSKIVN